MTTYKNYLKKSHLIILAFIFSYLFGLIIAGDYGISWDENVRRIASQSNIKEIAIALGIGVIVGSWSSIALAPSLLSLSKSPRQ